MPGSIKLYQIEPHRADIRKELAYYHTEAERKRIVQHWRRKYNGEIYYHFIQIAPGEDLRKK